MNIPNDKLKYADLIRQLVPINELSAEVQNQVISKAELLNVKKKRKVFKEGGRDNFSYYLLDGEIELVANGHVHSSIIGATDRARYPMAQLQPRQFTGRATVDSTVLKLDRGSLDKLLVMGQGKAETDNFGGNASSGIELEVSELDSEEDVDWMTRMLSSELFSGIPTANIHQLFTLLEPVDYKAGDKIIIQGETGELYFIVQEGHCEILRASKPGSKELKLSELHPGDGFGEEALITGTPRNATVKMLTDGIVAQLSKDDFVTLIQNPIVKSVTSERAAEIVGQGGKWLDVRSKDEHEKSTIEGSMNVPLSALRGEVKNLSLDVHYIMFCDTGARSSAATFVLTDRGLTASCLEGGLINHPKLAPLEERPEEQEAPKPEVKQDKEAPQAATAKAETQEIGADKTPAKPPKPLKEEVKPNKSSTKDTEKVQDKAKPVPAAKPVVEKTSEKVAQNKKSRSLRNDDTMDPEIMATVLEAESTLTNMRLQRIKKKDQTDIKYKKMAEDLEKEKHRIEDQKKRIASEVTKLRKQEQERLKKLEKESEARMQMERKKIEKVYSKNAEEMEKLEKLKQETEAKLKAERVRLEKEAEEAKKNKQDAVEIRKKLEDAKKAMEEEAKKQHAKQDEMRKKIEMEARKKIELEKRKLAEQFTRNNQEIENARREKAIADAARKAAKKEAEKMIEEFKTDFEKNKELEQERLKLERLKLEDDQKKIQMALKEIQQTRADAEAMRQAAMDEVKSLKVEQQMKESVQDDVAIRKLKEQIKEAQDKLVDATKKAIIVEKDEEKAVVAQKENKEGLLIKQVQQDELSKQVAADLEEFEGSYEVEEKKFSASRTQLDHMRRIKERADAARQAAEQANLDLMSDISSQLGKTD
jgi:CRP-like cAMP-binding protein